MLLLPRDVGGVTARAQGHELKQGRAPRPAEKSGGNKGARDSRKAKHGDSESLAEGARSSADAGQCPPSEGALQEILSGSEVSRLLDATTSLKYRAIFMLT